MKTKKTWRNISKKVKYTHGLQIKLKSCEMKYENIDVFASYHYFNKRMGIANSTMITIH